MIALNTIHQLHWHTTETSVSVSKYPSTTTDRGCDQQEFSCDCAYELLSSSSTCDGLEEEIQVHIQREKERARLVLLLRVCYHFFCAFTLDNRFVIVIVMAVWKDCVFLLFFFSIRRVTVVIFEYDDYDDTDWYDITMIIINRTSLESSVMSTYLEALLSSISVTTPLSYDDRLLCVGRNGTLLSFSSVSRLSFSLSLPVAALSSFDVDVAAPTRVGSFSSAERYS